MKKDVSGEKAGVEKMDQTETLTFTGAHQTLGYRMKK